MRTRDQLNASDTQTHNACPHDDTNLSPGSARLTPSSLPFFFPSLPFRSPPFPTCDFYWTFCLPLPGPPFLQYSHAHVRHPLPPAAASFSFCLASSSRRTVAGFLPPLNSLGHASCVTQPAAPPCPQSPQLHNHYLLLHIYLPL